MNNFERKRAELPKSLPFIMMVRDAPDLMVVGRGQKRELKSQRGGQQGRSRNVGSLGKVV